MPTSKRDLTSATIDENQPYLDGIVAGLTELPYSLYVVKQKGLLFGKRVDLYRFSVHAVESPTGRQRELKYRANSTNVAFERDKKKMEITVKTANGSYTVTAKDGESPWGFLRRRLMILSVDSGSEQKIKSKEIEPVSIG